MTLPKWLVQFEEAVQQKAPRIVLVFNTSDFVYAPDAGIPAPVQLKYFLARYLGRRGYAIGAYSLAAGLQELRPPEVQAASPFAAVSNTRDPEQVLGALTTILRRSDHRVAVIIDYADHLAPSSTGMTALLSPFQVHAVEVLHGWSVDEAIRATDNVIILLSHENQINDLLTRNGGAYRVIPVDLPSEEERQRLIERIAALRADGRLDLGALPEGYGAARLAKLTGGLRNGDILELFRLAAARNEPLDPDLVRARKAEVIKQMCRNLLEVFEPTYGLNEVAGLPHVKDYFRSLAWRVHQQDTSVPQAILLQGVPGTGKGHVIGAIASELGYPWLALRGIREQWVGASERNLELVLWVAETLAPCLIWIDEIDQVFGQRTTGQSADGGTSERMMGRIWEFMGAMRHRGRILWVATTNRPDLLDTAMLDRFQVAIPFLHPTPTEIEELLPVLSNQLGRRLAEDVDVAGVVAELGPHPIITVRALQEILATAAAWTDLETERVGTPIAHRHLVDALRDFKPSYNLLQHELIGLTAVRMTSFHSLLPWMSRGGKRANVQLPPYLEEIVDPETGAVDQVRLENRIQELQGALYINRVRQAV